MARLSNQNATYSGFVSFSRGLSAVLAENLKLFRRAFE